MPSLVRVAVAEDAQQILAIYAPFCADTPVSFEVQPPSAAEMRERITRILTSFPWLVWEKDGVVLGYAYASRHRERAAYQWSVDATVYVSAGARRQGIGRKLYNVLFQLLRRQGFYNAFAGITLPNPASVGLHEALGFKPLGVYRHVGYKLGAWHDVGWWQLELQEAGPPRRPPTEFAELRGSPEITRVLDAANGA